MIFYDQKAEKIAIIRKPSCSEETDKRNRIKSYYFTATIDFEYQDNPIDPKTGQLTKRTFQLVSERYSAKRDTKEKAEDFFRQLCIKTLGSSIKKIDEKEADIIRNSW